MGEQARLTAFDDDDSEVLAYLQRHGLSVGVVVAVLETGPRRSPLTLGHAGGSAVISRELATTIQTAPVSPEH